MVTGLLPIAGIYQSVFLLAAAVCFLAVIGSRRIGHPDIRRGLTALLVLSGVWSLLTALQLSGVGESTARLLHHGGLIVGITTVFAWLVFASAYAGHQYHRQRSLQLASSGTLAAILLVKVTNPIHEQYFTVSRSVEPFAHWVFEYGAIHWFISGFAYTAAIVGFFWLFESFERGRSRPTLLYALVGVTALPLVPFLLAEYAGLLLLINYEPLGVAVFAVGVLFYAQTEFANHSSPGQTAIAAGLSGGALVLDKSEIVIDTNEQVATILGKPTVPRTPLAAVDEDLAALESGDTVLRQYPVDGSERVFEVQRSAVEESLVAAELITFADVTRTVRVESLVSVHRELTDALVAGDEPWELIGSIPDSIAEIPAYDLVWLSPADGQAAADGTARRFGDEVPPGVAAGSATEYANWVEATAANTDPLTEAAANTEIRHEQVDEADGAWAREADSYGITACIAVPMAFADGERYVFGVYTTAPDGFAAAEREILTEISNRLPQVAETITTYEEAHQYEEALKHAGVAISITDADGVIQYVNPAFEELTGYSADEAIGSTHRILKSGEMDEGHYDQLWETITDGEIFKEQAVNRRKDGDRYILQQTISPVTDDNGEPKAYIGIQFDITDKLLREQRLSVLNRVLRHNLRTSINVIAGQTTVLEDRLGVALDNGKLPSSITEPLGAIRTRADHINSQAEAAREIEQIVADDETGRSWVPVEEVLEAACDVAEVHGGQCAISVADEVADCRVDREAVRIISELVENALVHHTADPSAVDLQVSVAQSATDVAITVEDDGPGLSEQELVVVEDGNEDPLRHGSGLGLWKINWLAISCGGTISATTDEAGTTIRVELPIRGTALVK